MKKNSEIRREVWKTLSGKWFFRLLTVGLVLQLIALTAEGLLAGAFSSLEISSLSDYLTAKIQARANGIDYALPTSAAYGWMLGGFCLQMFISYIFAAIVAFGFMRTLLKAHASDDDSWFTSAFGGFSNPLEITWLLFLQNFYTFLWSLLFVLPGIIAAYRYRLAWFVKIERPEMSAQACICESSRLMRGFKWKAFVLDCSILLYLFLAFAFIVATEIFSRIGGLIPCAVGFLCGITGFYLIVRTVLGMALVRAVFYREVLAEHEARKASQASVAETPGGTSIASSVDGE